MLTGVGYILTRDLASPQVILCVAWSISLFLASLNVKFSNHISHFNEALTTQTWLIIMFSILSFFIGATISMYPIRTKKREELGQKYLNWSSLKLDRIILSSFTIAILIYLFAIVKNGGVPAFSVDVNEDRAKFIPGTLGVFLTLFQLVILLAVTKATIYGVKCSRFSLFLALVSLICSLLTTQRVAAIESLLMAIFMFIFLWPYTSKEIRDKRKNKLLIFGTVSFSVFIWGFVLIGETRGLDLLQLTDLDNLVIEQFYIYCGGPAPRNLQMILEGGIYYGVNEPTNGALFFRPFLWFMGYRDEVSLNDTFRGPNNATALFQYYIDLGLLGLAIFPFFWGVVCGGVYGFFRRKPSLRTGVVYAILASSIYFFPLSERFSEPSTIIKIVLFSLLISLILKVSIHNIRKVNVIR